MAATLAFFTLQAAYWPLTRMPGTALMFWQFQWAAETGVRISAPVIAAILLVPTGNGWVHHTVIIGFSLAWSVALTWVAVIGIRQFDHVSNKPAAHVTDAVIPAASTPTVPNAAVQTPAQLARSAARPSAPNG